MPQVVEEWTKAEEEEVPVPFAHAVLKIKDWNGALATQIAREMTSSSRRMMGTTILFVADSKNSKAAERWTRENAETLYRATTPCSEE